MLGAIQYKNNYSYYNYNKPANINFKGQGNKPVKTSEIFNIDKDMSMAENLFFTKINPEHDIEEARTILKQRIRILPLLMDKLMVNTNRYTGKEVDYHTFTTTMIDDSVPFYKRLHMGKLKEEYAENYKPEIKMIDSIIEKCVQLRERLVSKMQLDDTVEEALLKYAKTSRKGIKHFTS